MSAKLDTIRFKFETSPVIKRALQLRAFLDDADLQDVVNAALVSTLPSRSARLSAAAWSASPTAARKKSTPPATPRVTKLNSSAVSDGFPLQVRDGRDHRKPGNSARHLRSPPSMS